MSIITSDVERCVKVLRDGGLLGLPTETVYGLAAAASHPEAVRRIFEVKGRPTDHPLIVHLGDQVDWDGWIADEFALRTHAETLAATVWPGPLTMIVPRGALADDSVTGGRSTVGLRVPAHPLTIELLNRLGDGVAAPSANRFGRVSPTTAQHVVDDIGDHLDPSRDAVLDGGASAVGVESTIVDLAGDDIQILRHGAITDVEIAELLSSPVAATTGPSRASGMLAAHYAPTTPIVLAADAAEATSLADDIGSSGRSSRILDPTADLVGAARTLYDDLRRADLDRLDALIVVLPPAAGLGHALRDRLTKAAAGSSHDDAAR